MAHAVMLARSTRMLPLSQPLQSIQSTVYYVLHAPPGVQFLIFTGSSFSAADSGARRQERRDATDCILRLLSEFIVINELYIDEFITVMCVSQLNITYYGIPSHAHCLRLSPQTLLFSIKFAQINSG